MRTRAKNVARKTNRRIANKTSNVAIVGSSHPVVKHFKLVEHRHTGKIIHHRNTSHGLLAFILLFVGIFMYFTGYSSVGASGTVTIGLTVNQAAPKVGAVITSPENGTKYKNHKIITISGTCPKQLFVVVKNNDKLIGSTVCYENNTFSIKAQLDFGTNVLTALDYDNLNQPGPATGTTIVTIEKPVDNTTSSAITPTEPKPSSPIVPVLPDNPSIIVGVSALEGVSVVSTVDNSQSAQTKAKTCEDYDVNSVLPTGGDPHVAVVCVPRLFLPEIQQSLGYIVWGGTPPYSISIDWGSTTSTLNVKKTGYNTAKFTYTNPGIERINFNLKDKIGKEAVVQTAVQISGVFNVATNNPAPNGSTTNPSNNGNGTNIDNSGDGGQDVISTLLNTDWFKTPVPMYLLAVAITFGFWGGDIFDRKFGSNRIKPRTKRAA